MNSYDKPAYQWKNNEVVLEMELSEKGSPPLETIDTNYDQPNSRYGYWNETGRWIEIPYEDLNSEFKMQCLLLGVS